MTYFPPALSLAKNSRRRLLALVVLTGVAAGCQPAASGPLVDPPPQVDIALDEYDVDAPDELSPGRVVVEVANSGEQAHSLSVVELPDDYPDTFAEAFAESDEHGSPRALATITVVAHIEPGETHRFALDLSSGRYGLLCTLRDEDDTPHSRKGIAAQVNVE